MSQAILNQAGALVAQGVSTTNDYKSKIKGIIVNTTGVITLTKLIVLEGATDTSVDAGYSAVAVNGVAGMLIPIQGKWTVQTDGSAEVIILL